MHRDYDTSSWSKRPQHPFPCPSSISARMRKRRAFADKELENVMLEHELRQRELQNHFPFPSPALIPLLHPPPLPISPGLHGCSKDSSSAGASSCVPEYKYKPLCECGLQFYELFHLRSRSSTGGDYNGFLLCQSEDKEAQNGWKDCVKRKQLDLVPLPSQQRLKNDVAAVLPVGFVKVSSKQTEILNSDGSSATAVSTCRSDQCVLAASDTLSHIRTFDPRAQAGPRADPEESPHRSSARTPAVRPLPFSVEALLRA